MNAHARPYTILPEDAFLSLGVQHVAYIKAVNIPGALKYGIFLADGRPIGAAPALDIARVIVKRRDLEPALVH